MSENTTIGDNIRHLLTLHGSLSVSELARKTNIPQPTLHHLLNGVTKKPRQMVLEQLSTFFSVSIPQLTGALPLDKTIPMAIQNSFNITSVPLIELQSLKKWPSSLPTSIGPPLILDKQFGTHPFALKMNQAALEPLFPENAILIFDPDKKPQDRDFILVCLGEEEAILFNRLFIDESGYFIKQTQDNGNMALIKIPDPNTMIRGTLVEVRLRFE